MVGSVGVAAVLRTECQYRLGQNVGVDWAERNGDAALAKLEYLEVGMVGWDYVIGIVSEQVGMLSSVKQRKQRVR